VQPFRAPPSRPLTVLCVDDQVDALLIRKTLLERAGYAVLAALNAEDALQMFRANSIDAVVSDHLLPGATGTEMARQMKLVKPHVPILLLSGVVDSPAGIEHVDKFVTKAEGPETLLQALADVVSKTVAERPVAPPRAERTGRSAAPQGGGRRAATLAHEINNPLDSLSTLLYLADTEAGLTQEGHHYLALAREEVARISRIAHAVLRESRVDEARDETNVPQLLRSVIEVYKPRLELRGISVNTRYCAAGNLSVFPGPLRQAFSNLLLNASDAMPNGGRLHARVATAHEWRGRKRPGLRITFADTGCGIPARNLKRIFAPFYSTKGSGGSGLGLSLVKDVVLRHGGSLRVRSSTTPGHAGSVFTIFLPAQRPHPNP